MARLTIPQQVLLVVDKLKAHGFEAFIVGGCVRDLLRGVEPEDWDVATNAKPEQIQDIFPKSFLDNKFGTVTVLITDKNNKKPTKSTYDKKSTIVRNMLEVAVEVTPYRIESKYTDKRHPDEVKWAKTIEQDLARRDFTVNAMAMELDIQFTKYDIQFTNFKQLRLVDPFWGQRDLEAKLIRAVGRARERFQEDALRLMRAVRFAVTLGQGWQIENVTKHAIQDQAHLLTYISKERIRDELLKIIVTERASQGIDLLRQLGLMRHILPELEENYGVTQNKHHIYDCYEHALRSLDYAAKKGFTWQVRLAALLHDIGKPRAKQGEGPEATFYNHEVIGAGMVKDLLQRLKFSARDTAFIVLLVRYHLFYYNVAEVGESSVRRLVRKVGPENMEALLQLRQADRIGSGVPKAEPYKLRHLRYMIEKVSHDPILPKMLKVKGNDVMALLKIQPGPKVGQVLDILLGYVLEDPKKNERDFLRKEIEKLGQLSDEQLSALAKKARQEREQIETKKDQMTKKKYWVT